MADEVLEVLDREESRLLGLLARVQAAKSAYLGEQPEVTIFSNTMAAPSNQRMSSPRGRRKEIEDTVANYLAGKGERATSGELYDVVVRAGIDIGGTAPSKALASTLSTSARFNNVKGSGYGLSEWADGPGPKAEKKEAPTEESASASEVTDGEAPASLSDRNREWLVSP